MTYYSFLFLNCNQTRILTNPKPAGMSVHESWNHSSRKAAVSALTFMTMLYRPCVGVPGSEEEGRRREGTWTLIYRYWYLIGIII